MIDFSRSQKSTFLSLHRDNPIKFLEQKKKTCYPSFDMTFLNVSDEF